MDSELYNWLGQLSSTAFRWSAVTFVLVNGLAVAALAATRDRVLVNRWTGRLLAANLLLVGTGLGIPLVASATRLAVAVVSPGDTRVIPNLESDEPSVRVETTQPTRR
jgi:hypothetical protein